MEIIQKKRVGYSAVVGGAGFCESDASMDGEGGGAFLRRGVPQEATLGGALTGVAFFLPDGQFLDLARWFVARRW